MDGLAEVTARPPGTIRAVPQAAADAEVLLSAEALVELLGQPERAELPVTDGVSPLTVVHVDEAGLDLLSSLAPGVRVPWRVVVGAVSGAPRRPPPEIFDVALCSGPAGPGWSHVDRIEATLAELAPACAANPRAASVLCQLLRVNEGLSRADGLLAESFAYSMLLAGPEFSAWMTGRVAPPHRPSPHPVLVSGQADAVRVTLNRPEVRNAYDSETRDALVDVLRGLTALPAPPAVILSGAGPAFCSGGDLSQFGTTPDPVTAHAARTARSPGLLLHGLGATAQIHGACVGAGIELPAFCPRVVAAPGTTFRLPEVSMGLIPGAGGTASILARIGRHRTGFLALTGGALDVATALEWGLVDEIDEL
jgi:hypothetical protein